MKNNWHIVVLAIFFFFAGMAGRFFYERASFVSPHPVPSVSWRSERILPPPVAMAIPGYAIAAPENDEGVRDEVPSFPPAVRAPSQPAAASPRPVASPPPAGRKKREKNSAADLSTYKVQPRRAGKEEYMPDDESLTKEELKEAVNRNAGGSEWEAEGLVGNIIQGAKNVIDKVDDVTLDASRSALGSVASPDSAKIRPQSDGVNLRIKIPTDGLHIGR